MQDPVNDDEAVEDWFQAHKELYKEQDDRRRPKKLSRRKKRRPRRPLPPIKVGDKMRRCRGCKQEAPIELFRKKRCLACQVANFLETL